MLEKRSFTADIIKETPDKNSHAQDPLTEQESSKEDEILKLGERYRDEGKAQELSDLIKNIRPYLKSISKAKAAKLVQCLVDYFLDIESGIGIEIELCNECISWAKEESRVFLRQALQSRLISLYYDKGMYYECLKSCSSLLEELKRIDDKFLLVEVLLSESKTYQAVNNLVKSKVSLTSARIAANSIFCPTKLQAALDMQSGILHASFEKDFKVAFSYFCEAYEGFNNLDPKKALIALKYMLLSKIMSNSPTEVIQIINSKAASGCGGRDIEAMKSVALSYQRRSLSEFQSCLKEYKTELEGDKFIKTHLGDLYDNMLEQNLCKIIEPYKRVEIDHISKSINLPTSIIERKLCQMVLDRVIHGILDQGTGVLIISDEPTNDSTYRDVTETVSQMSRVVDSLYDKTKNLL